MAANVIKLEARTNWRPLRHEFDWLKARVRRMPKGERGAFIEREVYRIAKACVRVVQA